MSSVWLPVNQDSSNNMEEMIKNDESIKEIDLAQISEKEIFVRKADLVRLIRFDHDFLYRKTLKEALIIVDLQYMYLYQNCMRNFYKSMDIQTKFNMLKSS